MDKVLEELLGIQNDNDVSNEQHRTVSVSVERDNWCLCSFLQKKE